MEIIATILIALVTLVSTVVVWLSLPGTFFMAGLVLLWGLFSGFATFTINHFITVLVAVLLLEGIEFLLGGFTAKISGASNRSAWLGIVGGLVGTFLGAALFVLIGALVGLLTGSYLGVYWGEKQRGRSHRAAAGAALATLLGNMAAKLLKSSAAVVIGVWMIRMVTT